MKTRGHVLGCVSTALSIVVVVAGCSDSVTSAPTTRQVRPTMSRVADPTVGRHVFVLSGNVPADFADRVVVVDHAGLRMDVAGREVEYPAMDVRPAAGAQAFCTMSVLPRL